MSEHRASKLRSQYWGDQIGKLDIRAAELTILKLLIATLRLAVNKKSWLLVESGAAAAEQAVELWCKARRGVETATNSRGGN